MSSSSTLLSRLRFQIKVVVNLRANRKQKNQPHWAAVRMRKARELVAENLRVEFLRHSNREYYYSRVKGIVNRPRIPKLPALPKAYFRDKIARDLANLHSFFAQNPCLHETMQSIQNEPTTLVLHNVYRIHKVRP